MPRLKEHVSLQPLHTFGLPVSARWYIEIESQRAALEFLMDNLHPPAPILVLGGGSNVFFTQDVDRLVLHNRILGREVIDEDEQHVWLRVGAGENWHQIVLFALQNEWGGIENLSLIPGSMGAAPIQNIGAYGVELKEVFHSLEAIALETGQVRTFTREECEFGYRDSIFKRWAKGKYLITHVTMRLDKQPQLNTSYGAIETELQRLGKAPSIHSISEAVLNIRQSKLPDPAEIGNAGSFFKNPIVSQARFEQIQSQYPTVPHYPAGDDQVKVPAGWLIETCGWKGHRVNQHGVHAKQALVLVNYGGATGQDLYQLSEDILQSVRARFGIELEREVNVV